MVEPPVDRSSNLIHHRDSRCNFRRPQSLVRIKRQREAYRVADDIVGKNSFGRTKRPVLITPPRAGLPGIKPAASNLLPKRFVSHSFRASQTHRCANEFIYIAGFDSGKLQDQVNSVVVAIAFHSGPGARAVLIVK